jgi:lipopolysaccharide transport system permease protein
MATPTRPAQPVAAIVPVSETVIQPPVFSIAAALRSVASLERHWDLFYTLTLHRIRVRYKQSVLGIAWAVLQPLATMAVLTVVFSYIARIPTGDMPYAVIALAGLVPWTCFSNAITTATHSLAGQAQLVTRVYFPREILPLTYICAAAIDCALAGVLLIVVMTLYGVPPGPALLFTPVVIVVLLALVCGVAFVAAATQVRFRDVGVAMPIVLQLLMFASPVAYPLETVPSRFLTLYTLNPMAGIIENFRRSVLGTGSLHFESLAFSAVWAAILLPLGYAYFKWVEATAADLV